MFVSLFCQNMKNSEGFTLIELLVVLAVIGLLTSIILVALKDTRDKGKDAAIMRELAQVRIVSQLILVGNGQYNNLCDASNTLNNGNGDLDKLETKIKSLNGNQNVICYASGNTYCVSSPLVYGTVFCIDSEGIASTVKTCDPTDKICK